ncbi:DNA-directed RNA polymerase subunit B [Candidatus Pacearchaeota archaeon CG10_big_fil_rev_8_21_14_0_10_30_48]|nr:MAG: DNA-directed RNA polymerase subunit B [Candidatus Pacearchaeota archaeon CG10_big_fil_rev_8_21_14_0_10_30_48]
MYNGLKLNLKNDDHVVLKKYLSENSLVESNLKSFNNFIGKRMQEIVSEISENIDNEDIEIKLGKIRVGNPNVIESDGSTSLITPTEARLRNLTYSSPIYMEMSIKQDGQIENQEVEIGRIPVMVRSKVCNLYDKGKEDLEKEYMDPQDPGGYFIVNGNERIMTMIEDLAANQPFVEMVKKKETLRLFSSRGAYRIPMTITESSEGILEVTFSRFKNIPAIVLMKALGLLKEADIAKYIGIENDTVIVNLYEYAKLGSAEDAMMEIAEKTNVQGTKKEILDRIKQRLDSYFLPHIGLKREKRIDKAITLCKLIKQFLAFKEDPSITVDKDHYSNKRVRLSGDLLSDLFRVNLNILVRDVKYSLQKTLKRKKFFSIKTIAKSTLFSHRIKSAIATGSWIGERKGITQNMDKTNYMSILSQLQKVSSTLAGEQTNFLARTLHPTHYGRFCPIETPEGTEIGLRKNLALMAKISTRVSMDEDQIIKEIEKIGLSHEQGNYDVFMNGIFVGSIVDYHKFISDFQAVRRKGEISREVSIRFENKHNIIVILSDTGRVLRPLIIVDNGIPRLKDEHIQKLKNGEMKWEDLIKDELVEYVDASEEDNLLPALNKEDLTPEHTHLEIDRVAFLGPITSLVSFGNHDQSSRLIRGSKTQKQGLGLYAANYLTRIDTDVSILHYPQQPIVRSFVYDALNVYPVGQNIVVAVMTHEGYNMEDALVINQASVDRGFGRSTYFRPYSSVELNYAGGLADEIGIPTKDVSGYRTEESYRYLEDDGIVYPEAKLNSGEVMIGKISPPKFLSEARDISIKAQKEASSVMRQEESGIMDGLFITLDENGNKIVQVRTRDPRMPEPGDKFSTAHGQKGVIGALIPEEDIPFSVKGIRPDLIFNPHGIPSRMTVGYLLELITGKLGCLKGEIMDGTSFTERDIKGVESQLKELGFRYDGKETMYNGVTGKMMPAKIYIGDMYYLKLKYMVSNKMHARASGKVALLTRQPIEGRSRGGALRLGEMEQQALVAHGASLLLKERYDSDKVIINICSKCGCLGIKDSLRKKTYCPLCNSTEIDDVEVSYAFKLLAEELLGMHIRTGFELKNKYEE